MEQSAAIYYLLSRNACKCQVGGMGNSIMQIGEGLAIRQCSAGITSRYSTSY